MVAQPYKWLSKERCIFEFENKKFGIFVSYIPIELKNGREFTVANISFSVIQNEKFNEEDLNTQLTGIGKPRTVFSTVAEACIANKKILKTDVICLAGSDNLANKRSLLYSVALAEIRSKVKEFDDALDIKAKTSNGTLITMLSKIEFTHEEKEQLKDTLMISK